MKLALKFAALARRSQDLKSFTWDFSLLTATTTLDDEMLTSLFWIGGNFHRPIALPDTGVWRVSGPDPEHSLIQSVAHHHPAVWSLSPLQMESQTRRNQRAIARERIALELEPDLSDQVQELATKRSPVD